MTKKFVWFLLLTSHIITIIVSYCLSVSELNQIHHPLFIKCQLTTTTWHLYSWRVSFISVSIGLIQNKPLLLFQSDILCLTFDQFILVWFDFVLIVFIISILTFGFWSIISFHYILKQNKTKIQLRINLMEKVNNNKHLKIIL